MTDETTPAVAPAAPIPAPVAAVVAPVAAAAATVEADAAPVVADADKVVAEVEKVDPALVPEVEHIGEIEKVEHEAEKVVHKVEAVVQPFYPQPVAHLSPLALQSPESYAAQHVAT